jgi:hypothetical protein
MSGPDGPHAWPWRSPGGEACRVPGGAAGSTADAGGDSKDTEIVELALLLPARDVAALEAAAWKRGLTTGQAIRRLISGFLCHTR